MFEIYNNLFIGNENDCFLDIRKGWVVIHACKSPCHQRAVGYRGSLPKNHPNYLIKEQEFHLFLNIIDPDKPLFMPQVFTVSLDFIKKNISQRKVLIHCNNGISRAPSLALLYMAKRAKTISNENFLAAKMEFNKIFPAYSPSKGIELYLTKNWNEL
jgi:hypothetical protein